MMSVEVKTVSAEVEQVVRDIIVKNNVVPKSIKYGSGSQVGDGYGSETIAVEVKNESKSLHLFLKCAKNVEDASKMHMDKIFANEIFFYSTICPAYTKFLEERGVEDGFRNAPKYYGAVDNMKFREIIAMENLRSKGYTLFNRHKVMNDAHLSLVLKTFAKFHAVSFAIKDQDKKLHERLCENCFDARISLKAMRFDKLLADMAEDFFAKLDPIEDKDILDRCKNLTDRIIKSVMNIENFVNDYSILTKGDCWSNNMMLLYEDELEEKPIDVMLVDWQLICKASPVHDLMNLFYSVISKEALENSEHYMKIYHNELSKRIRELGSDPEVLYPYRIFETEWKQLAVFGFGVSIMVIKVMLTEKDETPNFEDMVNGKEFNGVEEFIPHIKKDDEYMRRMRYIARHLIRSGHL